MPRFPEVVQFRAPAGASVALQALAEAEGRPSGEILREALAARLLAAEAVKAADERAA